MSTYRVLHPLLVLFLAALLTPTGACNGHGSGGGGGSGGSNATPTPGTPVPGGPTPSGPPPLSQSRQFRALAGVSMGAYGAMNLGTKHSDIFSTIAALGGPVDMQQLLRDSVDDNLEVKPQTTIPRDVGDDFTYDHLAPYPDRDTRVRMFQDLTIAFGNPFLHHPDAARQYLGSDSEPAHIGRDDQFGTFTAPTDPLGFLDGGDENDDGLRQTNEQPTLRTEVSLLAKGSLPMIASGATPVDVGGRLIADLNGDGIYDVGEGIVVNLSEPFQDTNGNGVFDPGEPFSDFGLDGVAGTGDYGENNGEFDYDPDRANYIAEDPLTRVNGLSAAAISTQRIYMDVGTKDQFGFARHYDHFVAALQAKGLSVAVQDGFSGDCADLPSPSQQFLLVRYPAGHIGIESVDPGDILEGNVCGEATVWQRFITMLGFLNESFPDGFYGPGGDFNLPDINFNDPDINLPDLDIRGDVVSRDIPSPSLAPAGGSAPNRSVVVYVPPAYFHSDKRFPVVYFLGGYGQKPKDFEHVSVLLDALILSGQLQNMAIAFLPGAGGRRGSFYVNHIVPEEQVPNLDPVTSGRYEDSTIDDLIPVVENDILQGRIKQ